MQRMQQSKQMSGNYLADLNPSQLQAATHGEGPALVLAGPGSGKTTVIVRRILYLIREKQIPPEEILVVTFTKDAALSMQQRFVQQARQHYPVNFGTFHSIFYHILLEAGYFKKNYRPASHSDSYFTEGTSDDTEADSAPVILSQTQKKSIMEEVIKQRAVDEEGYYDYDTVKSEAEDFLRAAGFYKNTRDLEASRKYLPDGRKDCFLEILEAYQSRCRARGGLDFDDMVYECRRLLLENEGQRDYWQKRFRHILIDEFQDINPLQYEVVKLLGEKHRNLFAVGDDDQAIYGFRGSKPACLRQFERELAARQIILNANYRSTAEIVAAAEAVIGENRERFEKKCYAAGKDAGCTGSMAFRTFESRAQELAFVREALGRFAKEHPGESCGVLFRTNSNMQQLAAMLAKAGIPYEMKEQAGNLYEHFIARDISAYLRLAAGDRSRALLLRVMNRPVRFISRDSLAGAEPFDWQEIIGWYRERKHPRDEQVIQRVQKLQAQLEAMQNMPPGLAISYICRAVGYEEYLAGRKEAVTRMEEWQDIIGFLREDAKGYESVRQWEQAQRAADGTADGAPGRKPDRGKPDRGKPDRGRGKPSPPGQGEQENPAVHLLTVHGSKGLEFDWVYIPDCNEKTFPRGRMPDADTVEEERRIFYVGMTRAKKRLELLCTTGTKERPRLMSRFLNPIVGHSSINSSNSQLSRYSSKASATFSYSSSSSIYPKSGSSLESSGFSL